MMTILHPRRILRVFFWVVLATVVGLPFTARSVAEGEEPHAEAKTEAPKTAVESAPAIHVEPKPEVCLTDPSAVEEIRKRREELDVREKDLAKKEAEIAARAKAMEEELKRMEVIRDDMAKIDVSRKSGNEERIGKLVETLQLMSPKSASQLISTIEESLAVSALSKMDNQKLAKVLNLMEPAKASRLSELLAGVVRARNPRSLSPSPSDKSATTANPAAAGKGGDNHDANNEIKS